MSNSADLGETFFGHDYHLALSSLIGRQNLRFISNSARLLAGKAITGGISVVELTKTHLFTQRNIALSNNQGCEVFQKDFHDRCSSFLLEALETMESDKRKSLEEYDKKNLILQKQSRKDLERSKELGNQLKALENHLKLRTRQFILTQEEERKQMSRELHDQIAQTLTAVNVQLATLKAKSSQHSLDLESNISAIQHLVDLSVDIVHDFSRKLRPGMLDDLGLTPSLYALFRDFSNVQSLEIRSSLYPEVEQLSSLHRIVIYRIVQEALTNVVCHAQASVATITIRNDGHTVRLKIEDDGKSFDAEPFLSGVDGNHLGLVGMKERVEMIGGNFCVISTEEKGTTVEADFPITNKSSP